MNDTGAIRSMSASKSRRLPNQMRIERVALEHHRDVCGCARERMVAGLEEISSGVARIGDRMVNPVGDVEVQIVDGLCTVGIDLRHLLDGDSCPTDPSLSVLRFEVIPTRPPEMPARPSWHRRSVQTRGFV